MVSSAFLDMFRKKSLSWARLHCRSQMRVSRFANVAHGDYSQVRRKQRDEEDAALREAFDSRGYWTAINTSKATRSIKERTGLFQNHYLRWPSGFRCFAENTLHKCRDIVASIHAVSTQDGYKALARDFDRLSDLLCRVIDAADFVRSTHPDRRFQAAAGEAHSRMFEYMNNLNTDTKLNEQLKRALADRNVTSSWTEGELQVAGILKKDFAQSAIDLPVARRRRFVELSTEINDFGSEFLTRMRPELTHLDVSTARLEGIDSVTLEHIIGAPGVARVPTTGPMASHLLRSMKDRELRRELYIASRTASSEQVLRLERLICARAELARVAGFDSFARMTLTEKMARSPEAVKEFLGALLYDIGPTLRQENVRLLKLMQQQNSETSAVAPWDREYYRARIDHGAQKRSQLTQTASQFFSLGTVMQGLSRLFHRIYGVRLVHREPQEGETWSSDVRRLDAVDGDGNTIAVMYCDLFARPGKSPNPAHFTIRCSRLISISEIEEAHRRRTLLTHTAADTISMVNDGMVTSAPLRDGSVYQLPTIALICNLSPPSTTQPPLLSFSAVTDLFHEMGHAIHTILGRTTLQTISGTRCATDFSELPSILMEHFARDPATLALYAQHWETGEPLPQRTVDQLCHLSDRTEGPSDIEWQVLLALLDQSYHGEAPVRAPEWTSDEATHAVFAQYGSLPEPRQTRWQGFFGHLVGYGATYYAYLFDRAIASRVWDVVFGGGGYEGPALRRENGERFRTEVLRWGGGRDPWKCVSNVLGDETLAWGGEIAMAKVGQWGLTARTQIHT